MLKPIFAALVLAGSASIAVPVMAQEAPSTGQAAPASALTEAQIVAFNKAVADFTEGQKLQQGGDNAGASAKYDLALPAIRDAAKAEPENMNYVSFLGNALYAQAAAKAGSGDMNAVVALYTEAAPLWRKVVQAKPEDAVSRTILTGMLVQLGNASLAAQNKAQADPFYREAMEMARKSVAASAQDAVARNQLLGSLIGLSQTSEDASVREEAAALSKSMLADGSVDAANKPAAQALAGTAAPAGAGSN